MTRIVSYNILAGGYSLREQGARRTDQLLKIIRSAQPDIVGLLEATHPQRTQPPTVADDIAASLGMQIISGGKPARNSDYQTALLTRLPVVYSKLHARPGLLARPLQEVCVEEEDGQQLVIFVAHLAAAFNHAFAGGPIRVREVNEILKITAPFREQGIPHVIMGDCNSLAPGDAFKASHLLRYVVRLDSRMTDPDLADGHPHLNSIVPRRFQFLKPVLRTIARSNLLCNVFDVAASFYVPRDCIRSMQSVYVDCFRHIHPRDWGFTCPASAPAGRIDYIFASSTLAERLQNCHVITIGAEGLPGSHASDHLAVAAEFGLAVPAPSPVKPLDRDNVMTH